MIDRAKPLTEQDPGDLRAFIDALHGNRKRYDLEHRVVEARSCELEIAEATRALAIINRRATKAQDAEGGGVLQADVDALLHVLRAKDMPNAHALVARIWTALQVARPALTADEVRSVLGEVGILTTAADAARIVEKLAGRVVTLSPGDRNCLLSMRALLRSPEISPGGGRLWTAETALLDRLLATEALPATSPSQREADLREAFLAGCEHCDGWLDEKSRRGQGMEADEEAAAEYARSKAGA